MPIPAERVTQLEPATGKAFTVPAGATLRVMDVEGEQVADLVAYCADDLRECLSNGRTFDYASTLRLTSGAVLYSSRSRPMLTVVRDDVGVHDFLLAPCSRDTWRMCYGDAADERPGCLGNLAAALEPYGIDADAIPTAFNIFMNVPVGGDGALVVRPPLSRPGDVIEFRAECELVVGLTACSALLTNNGRLKPIAYAIII